MLSKNLLCSPSALSQTDVQLETVPSPMVRSLVEAGQERGSHRLGFSMHSHKAAPLGPGKRQTMTLTFVSSFFPRNFPPTARPFLSEPEGTPRLLHPVTDLQPRTEAYQAMSHLLGISASPSNLTLSGKPWLSEQEKCWSMNPMTTFAARQRFHC